MANILSKSGNSAFWGNASGQGTVNRRFRKFTPLETPVVSFVLESDGNDTKVSMWMSEWSSALGLANFAAMAVLLKRKATKRLLAAEAARQVPPDRTPSM